MGDIARYQLVDKVKYCPNAYVPIGNDAGNAPHNLPLIPYDGNKTYYFYNQGYINIPLVINNDLQVYDRIVVEYDGENGRESMCIISNMEVDENGCVVFPVDTQSLDFLDGFGCVRCVAFLTYLDNDHEYPLKSYPCEWKIMCRVTELYLDSEYVDWSIRNKTLALSLPDIGLVPYAFSLRLSGLGAGLNGYFEVPYVGGSIGTYLKKDGVYNMAMFINQSNLEGFDYLYLYFKDPEYGKVITIGIYLYDEPGGK